MSFGDTVQSAIDGLSALGPWGLLIGALLAIVGPKLGPVARAAIDAVLSLLGKIKIDPDPSQPTPPTPSPAVPQDRPVLNLSIELVKLIAQKRFPWLTQDEALVRYAQEQLAEPPPQPAAASDGVLSAAEVRDFAVGPAQ